MIDSTETTMGTLVEDAPAPGAPRHRGRFSGRGADESSWEDFRFDPSFSSVTTPKRQLVLAGVGESALGRPEWAPIQVDLFDTIDEVDRASYRVAKRVFDLIVAGLALALLSPLMLLTAIAIKLTDGGSIFYTSTRVGYRGREFACFKFRSMVENADDLKSDLQQQNHHGDSRTFKMARDPRLTAIGWYLRKFSIDELPQLLNVLRGDMSLVGPRPPVPSEVAQYSLDDMRRLEVQPGLTCIWQVSGRSDIPFPEQLRMDLEYIQRRSMWTDVVLLLRTIPAVLSARGAY